VSGCPLSANTPVFLCRGAQPSVTHLRPAHSAARATCDAALGECAAMSDDEEDNARLRAMRSTAMRMDGAGVPQIVNPKRSFQPLSQPPDAC